MGGGRDEGGGRGREGEGAIHCSLLLQLVFSSAQTYTLSHYLLQLTMPPSSPFTAPPNATPSEVPPEASTEHAQRMKKMEEDLLALLRLTLVKYLSRALMEESSQ